MIDDLKKQQVNKKENGESKENASENDTVIPEELLDELPPEDRKELIQSITRISGVFPQQNPILKKITPEHITALISNANETDKRDREERSGERSHNYKILITVLIAVMVLCGLFMWANQLDFLKYIIGAILGFGGGFGVGKHYKSKD